MGRWDRARLEGIVTSLFTNAVKFGAERPIEVTVDTVDNRARVAVRDHGIGIDKAHGGSIRVESASGRGTTFIVELPY